jgi:protein O-GlcNAcase/histone acetyltransferase
MKVLYKGVIEGFYGRPWTHAQRIGLLHLLKKLGMNTYMYAPKNDLRHRREWRRPYTKQELHEFSELGRIAKKSGIIPVFSLSPGLAIRYASRADRNALLRKFLLMKKCGFTGFALLVDDIPDKLSKKDSREFPSLAAAHADLANGIYRELQCRHFFLCPTYYSYEQAADTKSTMVHLKTLGDMLHPDIQVFWTGNQTIAEKILPSHIRPVSRALKRRPVVWDNYFADDYTSRVFLGPLYGRSPGLLSGLNGLLINPSCFFEVACMSLLSASAYLNRPSGYQPRQAYRQTLLKTAGPEHAPLLKAVADIYHSPFQSTSFVSTLKDILALARTNAGSALQKFMRNRQVLLLKNIWDLEHIPNGELYLSIFPWSVQAHKLMKAMEYYLRLCAGERGMQEKLDQVLQRMGFAPGKEPEKIILSLLN